MGIDWGAPFYGDRNCQLAGTETMMGFSMTILMGTYRNDMSDVALVADRRSIPAISSESAPVEDTVKTLRLGDKCAIGFAGAVPLENHVLADLLRVPLPPQDRSLLKDLLAEECNYDYEILGVMNALNEIVPGVIDFCRPPPEYTLYIILAGEMPDGRPILMGCCLGTKWRVEPYFSDVWSLPREMRSYEEQQRFHDVTHMPGMDYDDRMIAAVKYCSKHPSVNNHYIIRRLNTGFIQETGSV